MIEGYNDLHKDEQDNRNMSYSTLVNSYYELATLFYEWGWGQCFHFAYQLKGESFRESISRHEYYLAGRLGVKQGDRVLDVGCGIGGPMRNIARFTRAKITGVTLNEYQVIRGNELNAAAGLSNIAESVQCDFMKLDKFADNTFDGKCSTLSTCSRSTLTMTMTMTMTHCRCIRDRGHMPRPCPRGCVWTDLPRAEARPVLRYLRVVSHR
jgi:sterol 24-C-methyltransferase